MDRCVGEIERRCRGFQLCFLRSSLTSHYEGLDMGIRDLLQRRDRGKGASTIHGKATKLLLLGVLGGRRWG